MTTIKLKRVYDDPEAGDGFRVFVDRLWPRGVKKEALHYDMWAKNIAPSADLRKWFHQNTDNNWTEFVARYRAELNLSAAVKDFIATASGYDVVTLLYASKNATRNHALVLKDFIEEHI
ncbi:uncharacterized protein YeaO (DUF488 family) [Dysgonomonas sp. PH5-45]|uniref:DUF488 domain-containing protein n=1 Tax=unclassified Dysgonomonas TaxID=2630389 RepID=UPI00247516F5|nr:MULTISPECIES: DUF488 family protein [unclassified Dysgonomonas]MDH6354518.1 uncharacterized protein YeaO (DUF488 family) [Dysgonomonas sp. PH5-45]MDH6387426.1 uncharacterized protein YeaO (DUF488 family) [Dysgonomonas sp. PH5-37]